MNGCDLLQVKKETHPSQWDGLEGKNTAEVDGGIYTNSVILEFCREFWGLLRGR